MTNAPGSLASQAQDGKTERFSRHRSPGALCKSLEKEMIG